MAGMNPGCSHRLEGGVSLRGASGVGDGRLESFLGSDTLVHVPRLPGVLLTRGHHQWPGSTLESLDSLGRQAAQGGKRMLAPSGRGRDHPIEIDLEPHHTCLQNM